MRADTFTRDDALTPDVPIHSMQPSNCRACGRNSGTAERPICSRCFVALPPAIKTTLHPRGAVGRGVPTDEAVTEAVAYLAALVERRDRRAAESKLCPVCGRHKGLRHIVCFGCSRSLPQKMLQPLFDADGDAYNEAVLQGRDHLRASGQLPAPGAKGEA